MRFLTDDLKHCAVTLLIGLVTFSVA